MLARFLSLLLLSLGLAAQQPAPSAQAAPSSVAPHSFQISGTLVHALNGEPIAGAEVLIAPTGKQDELQTVLSESNGHFLFKNVAPGKYTLIATHRGFPQQPLDGHGFFSTAIAVGPGKDSENILFRLKPEGSISGKVTDEQDDPLRNAAVMLFARHTDGGERAIDLSVHGTTDDQGYYHFGHLSAGTYYVAVSAQPWYAQHAAASGKLEVDTSDNPELDVAYPITYYRQTIEPDAATPITLSWGDRLTADITLRAVPAIHLRLSNQNPNLPMGIEGATLKQTLLGGNTTFVEAQIENIAPNVMEITGLPPGRYDMGVETSKEKNGTIFSTNSRHQALNAFGNGAVDAAAGSELATLNGSLLWEDRQNSPPEASVQFHNRESGQQFELPVSPKGDFDSAEIGPGHYDLILLNAEGFIFKSIAAVNAKVTGQSIDISGSDHVQLTLVAYKANGRVEGVAMRENKPIAGAMIVLVPQDPLHNWPLFRRDQSDSDGTFELSSVLPGKYTVLAIENGWDLEWANPAVLQPYLAKGQAVQVDSNSKINLTIQCLENNPGKVQLMK